MEKIYHDVWQKEVLAAQVINREQLMPFRRQTVMSLLSVAKHNGWATALENMEAAISVTDDAIQHMMGVKR